MTNGFICGACLVLCLWLGFNYDLAYQVKRLSDEAPNVQACRE